MRAELLQEWPALARVSHGALTPLTVHLFSRAEINTYLSVVQEIKWRESHG